MMSITERDSAGRIVSKELSSEKAREMVEIRWKKEASESVEGLLSDFGFTIDDAPAHISLWAKKAVTNTSYSVQALVNLQKALYEYKASEEAVVGRLKPGDICPYCQQPFDVELSKNLIVQILKATGGQVIDA